MNNGFYRWMLNIDQLPADADDIRLVWEHSIQGWIIILVILMILLTSVWSYTRIETSRPTRIFLASTRFLLLLLLFTLAIGPMLMVPREQTEEDWVIMMLDRSMSMEIADTGDGDRISRDQQLLDLVRDNSETWDLIDEDRNLLWLGFHSSSFQVHRQPGELLEPGDPSGWRTDLSSSIRSATQKAAARPVSGIILLTDGRTTNPPDPTLIRSLTNRSIPIFPIPLGSSEPVGDLAIRKIDSPRRAFTGDRVPVIVDITSSGSSDSSGPITIELVDSDSGNVIDTVNINSPGDQSGPSTTTLLSRPETPGRKNWTVRAVSGQDDINPTNNSMDISIEMIDRPLRVLYIDGYPRWEYRYLKNLLIRESTIESSVMLLSADRDFAQEGNMPITRIPRSPEEFSQYDLIIIGDVPSGTFNESQLESIAEMVSNRGAGLMWIGGPRSTPSSWEDTPLESLLPMTGNLDVAATGTMVNMDPTPLAHRLGLLNLSDQPDQPWPDELLDPTTGWSGLGWSQFIHPSDLKPTVEVIATTHEPVDGVQVPIVTKMRYGSGETIYVGTDETWRWRYGRGEQLPERFWLPLIRMLARESGIIDGESVRLLVSPTDPVVGDPVRFTIEVLDSMMFMDSMDDLLIEILDESGSVIDEVELNRMSEDSSSGTWFPFSPGTYTARLDDSNSIPMDEPMEVEVVVTRSDDERRHPETDHRLLSDIADSTGGRIIPVDEVPSLVELLPRRSITTENPIRERIWDSPLALALVLLLLTLEWVGRKLVRLV